MIFVDVHVDFLNFLMKECQELFTIFQKNCNEVQTQHFIRVLGSDKAKDYFSTSFNTPSDSSNICSSSFKPTTWVD